MAQCLITGSKGFIGKALSKELIKKGHTVTGLPRDLLYNRGNLTQYLKKLQPDYIFHFAAYGNKYDQQDELKIIRANINGLLNLLYASKDISYQGFINCSSSSTLLPYETFYSATKGAGERLVKAFLNKYHKPIVTIRPYSVYGPGDDPNHFIPVAINAFKNDLDLKLAPGSHDWIHIIDLVSGIIKAMENIDKVVGKEINIGTGYSVTNYGVIAILRDILAKPGRITRIEQIREYDTEIWIADNSILRKLGWQPKIKLEDGLEELIYGN